jgi:hypothetical protein
VANSAVLVRAQTYEDDLELTPEWKARLTWQEQSVFVTVAHIATGFLPLMTLGEISQSTGIGVSGVVKALYGLSKVGLIEGLPDDG